MGKIRVNDLARELEVKSKAVLDYLQELGVAEKKSHSSAIEDDLVEKVRAHFREVAEAESKALGKPTAEPAPPEEVRRPAPVVEAKKILEAKPEARALTRSIAEIKAEARKVISPARPPAVAAGGHLPLRPPEVAAGPPLPPGGLAGRPPIAVAGKPATVKPVAIPAPKVGEKLPVKAGPAPEALVAGGTAGVPAGAAARTARTARAQKSAASNQPIYQVGAAAKAGVARPYVPRRPGEPRPMHPTAARPAPLAGGAVPAVRQPAARPVMPPRWGPSAPRAIPLRPVIPEEVPITRQITISEGISVKELSERLDARAKDVIKRLLDRGLFATINQTLDGQIASEIARLFGAEASVVTYEEEILHEVEEADQPEDLVPRSPVVTVMGHVDHGKTSLLDAIRETNVTAQEAGGITQHIGAYQVEVQKRKVVFLDTPGHEAFTLMRARGARVTDIVVLVVAADDGVMPQTIEAINHARAAKVPIVVAINKIDKPEAMPERVRKQLADHGLLAEAWGGDTVMVEVSARQKTNLGLLLEMILLVADLQALKANPKRLATGTVLEGRLDRGRGPVASILIQNGTVRVGDSFIVGAIFGRVRAMLDDRGRPVIEAAPSTPVEVLGLEDVPQAGDKLQVIEDTLKARQISFYRLAKLREAALAKSSRLTLEQLHEQLAAGEVKELALIIKADVQGSVEVLNDTLTKLSSDKVKVKIIHAGVGAITESDVLLATASNAVIIGFNVRPERKASELAQLEKVDLRLHTIIYNVTEEIQKAMAGLLAVTYKEATLGHAEVRETFRIPKVGTVAGCYLRDGKVTREAKVRVLRDNVVVHEGKVRSLRRFKEDVTEVKSGMECGLALENFNDVKIGDVIEAFVVEKVAEPATV